MVESATRSLTERTSPRPLRPKVNSHGNKGRSPTLAFLLRWSWLLALCVLAGAGAAYEFAKYGPMPLRSTAVILVPSQGDPATNTQGSALQARSAAESFAIQASTPHLYGLVSDALRGKVDLSARDLLLMDQNKQIDIHAPRDGNVISISVTDTDGATAQLLADTIAQVFVQDVNARARDDLDARRKQLQDRIELTRRQLTAAQLYQHQQDLVKAIADERNQFAQLQLQYITELQHEVELDRLDLTPERRETVQAVRGQWLDITSNQQQTIKQRLDDLTSQLDAVQAQLEQLPEKTDPVISAAFAGAYSQQLQAQTQQFVQLEVNGQAASSVLVPYGSASPALPAESTRKVLAYGAGGGLAAGAVLTLLLELVRQQVLAWRSRRASERAQRLGTVRPAEANVG
jgi:uncharacterized protein involved in exopolysaccharide biosynthesis